MTTERKTKRERLAAIMAEITTSEVSTPKEITIVQDGKTLHGSTWITPQDFAADEVERGDLASLKGCTPPTLPTLDDDQVDDPPEGGAISGSG